MSLRFSQTKPCKKLKAILRLNIFILKKSPSVSWTVHFGEVSHHSRSPSFLQSCAQWIVFMQFMCTYWLEQLRHVFCLYFEVVKSKLRVSDLGFHLQLTAKIETLRTAVTLNTRPVSKYQLWQNMVTHALGIHVRIRVLQNWWSQCLTVVSTLWVMLTETQFSIEAQYHDKFELRSPCIIKSGILIKA